jgi:hypothetical protein
MNGEHETSSARQDCCQEEREETGQRAHQESHRERQACACSQSQSGCQARAGSCRAYGQGCEGRSRARSPNRTQGSCPRCAFCGQGGKTGRAGSRTRRGYCLGIHRRPGGAGGCEAGRGEARGQLRVEKCEPNATPCGFRFTRTAPRPHLRVDWGDGGMACRWLDPRRPRWPATDASRRNRGRDATTARGRRARAHSGLRHRELPGVEGSDPLPGNRPVRQGPVAPRSQQSTDPLRGAQEARASRARSRS